MLYNNRIPPAASGAGCEAVVTASAFLKPSTSRKNMKTIVYIDGFNLYYGAVKDTPYKWLDISCLCKYLLPNNQIIQIKYFTALVSARPDDPDKPVRQQIYLRALRTIPNLQIFYGHFLEHVVRMPLAHPLPNGPKIVEVIKTEEKGSDVNLASHLINDGYQARYQVAVVVSNDSDLVEPIKIIRQELNLPVIVLNPFPRHPSKELQKYATFVKPIRRGVVAASQFPPTLVDTNGVFSKPAIW